MNASTPPTALDHTAARTPAPKRRITDAPTRITHALMALSFTLAYATADSERWRLVHVVLGYTFLGLWGWRMVYGFIGPRSVRVMALLRRLSNWQSWLQQAWAAVREREVFAFLSHALSKASQNLYASSLQALLLLTVLPLTVFGIVANAEWDNGLWNDIASELHEGAGEWMLALVLGHVGLLLVMSVLRGQNLTRPMVQGTQIGPGPHVVARNHVWLAALIGLGVLGYWFWEAQQALTR